MVWFVKTGYEHQISIPSFPKLLCTFIDNEDLLSPSTYKIFKHQLTLLWFSLSSPCCYLITKSWLTLCSTPDSSVLHYLPKFAQIHVPWVNDAIQPSHPLPSPSIAFSLFLTLGPFPVIWLITLGGQSIGDSALTSVLPINIQGWFPLGLTNLISLQSKGL